MKNILNTKISNKIAILSFAFILPRLCQAAPEVLKGVIILDQKEQDVTVTYTLNGSSSKDKIQIGKSNYIVNNVSKDEVGGRRVVTENDIKIVEDIIQVYLSTDVIEAAKKDSPAFAKSREFKNAADFKCGKNTTAIVTISDNLNKPYPTNGYCLDKK